MCTNKRWITTQQGKKLFVKCGSCPACLQEKALNRYFRIVHTLPTDSSVIPLFVTLTYKNKFLPYFSFDEFRTSPIVHTSKGNPLYPDGRTSYKRLRIYRDAVHRYDRFSSGYETRSHTIYRRTRLSSVNIPYEYCCDGADFISVPNKMRGKSRWLDNGKCPVIFYKDVQDFFKRLRINLKRNYNYEVPFHFYSCSEYGPTTCRPHFHLLLFVKRRVGFSFGEDTAFWQAAISEAWPYADKLRTRKNIEIARNAASYVSSYVNCDASVPRLFRCIRSLAPKHSYSQGFGMALREFSLPAIFEAYLRGDLHTDVPRIKQGVLVVDRVLFPKYVLSRYFPKFKRFNCFTPDEIKSISERPILIHAFKERYQLTDEEADSIEVTLTHKRDYALSHGLTLPDFSEMYSRVWSLYASGYMRDFYDSITNPLDFFYAYDNIKDFYYGDVQSNSLFDIYPQGSSCFVPVEDPNFFPDNIHKTLYFSGKYFAYSKDKKIRSLAESSFDFQI